MPANSQLLAPGSQLPAGSQSPASSPLPAGSSLPADLLEQASRRLGITCLVVFTGDSALQIVARHVSSVPTPPSRHSGFDVSPALDQLVLACLEKKPSNRPGTARELCDRLGQCEVERQWTRDDARVWWETKMEPEKDVALV